ncbi:LOW QUALITY PROTEIN: hypothetical protein U9M48_027378 [Paspalum notatum var. saurae]|uniref:Integrase catalytic domain-containing protein n=1 Tax=Paspalum notatum var. saurae TaxID=547442 RepID=A0AAQ3TV17_PASNO
MVYPTLRSELEQLRADFEVLSAPTNTCENCLTLRMQLVDMYATIKKLKKGTPVIPFLDCDTCAAQTVVLEDLRDEVLSLQDDNNRLREVLSWFWARRPQLEMIIEGTKRVNSDLGGIRFGECSTSGEKSAPIKIKAAPTQPDETVDGVYHEPPRAAPTKKKQFWTPKASQTELSKIVEEVLKPKDKKPAQQPAPPKTTPPKPKSQSNPVSRRPIYHCEFCQRNDHLEEFCFRRKRVERQERAWGNQDQFYQGDRQDPPHRGEMRDRFAGGERGGGFQARAPGGERRFVGRALSHFQRGYGPRDREFVRELERPRFEGHGYSSRVLDRLLTVAYLTLQDQGMEDVWIMDSGCSRHMTGHRKWFSSLNPVSTKEYITFGDNGQGKVLGVGSVSLSAKVSLREVAFVRNLGFNLVSVSQLLDEGFEGACRVLDAEETLVCSLLPYGQFKDEAFGFVQDLVLRLGNKSHKAMRAIRSDNDGKFRNSQFENFYRDLGLEHQFSSPYTPLQNGVVERKNCTLIEMARTMLDEHSDNEEGTPIFEDEEGADDVGDAGTTASAAASAPSATSSDDEGGPLPTASSSLPRQQAQAEAGSAEDVGEVTSEIVPSRQVQWDHPPHRIIGDLHQRVICSSVNSLAFFSHSAFVASFEPRDVSHALSDPNWVNTMHEELENFERNHVWDLVEPPPNCYPIGTKWVFKNKQGENEIVVRNKARLVAQGFCQKEGIDYEETFAPLVWKPLGFCLLLLPLKASNCSRWMSSTFLNGFIEEEVYVRQPPGFESAKFLYWVYNLRKALYGLKQAPRAWYARLRSFLLKSRFVMGSVDKTLFLLSRGGDTLIVQIYVDNIIFGGSSHALVSSFAEQMSREFEMSLMGKLQFFLGLQIKQGPEGTFIHQAKYTKDILKKVDMSDSKPITTPMSTNTVLDADEDGEAVDQKEFRGMIGSLLYLTATRLDIQFVAVKRIFRCLKFTSELGLWYSSGSSLSLRGFSDADHAGCRIDLKSTSGTCQLLGTSLVSWSSHKQASVSLSTTEAEIPLLVDSTSAISVAKNPVLHSRTKHIDVRFHFLRDHYEKGDIDLVHGVTQNQLQVEGVDNALIKGKIESQGPASLLSWCDE